MEFKRKLRISTITKRRFIVADRALKKEILCPQCGTVMLDAKEVARSLGISQSAIFRVLENDAAHSVESRDKSVVVCLSSIMSLIDDKTIIRPDPNDS